MNNFLKKFVAGTAAVVMLSSMAVFAEEVEINADYEDEAVEVTEVAAPAETIIVNAETINGVTMLPLRSISEHFGYTVEWVDETSTAIVAKGAKNATLSIGVDAYAFSRMAPMPLGAAPFLFNDTTTYVPVNFFTEILGMNCHETEEGIAVAEPRVVELIGIEEDGALLVSDEFHGEVLIHISEETVITANGEVASADMFEAGQLLSVEYANFMTMSIPPQTAGIEIEILNLPVEVE